MLCFRPLTEVEERVNLLVTEIHINQLTLKLVLEDWIQSELIPQHLREGIISEYPNQFNRSYYPTKRDIQNLVQGAILKQRNSLFDQVHIMNTCFNTQLFYIYNVSIGCGA